VPERVQYKIAVLVYKVLHGLPPQVGPSLASLVNRRKTGEKRKGKKERKEEK